MMKAGGVPYREARVRYGVSSSYYTKLGEQAERLLDKLTATHEAACAVIVITPQFVERCVIALLCICRTPVERIVEFFDTVLHFHVSKGRVGNIQERVQKKARSITDAVPLGSIKYVALDEIFQQGKPVLTGVDLETQYIPLMEPVKDRTGETWESSLNKLKERAFHPSVCVSDAGSGLQKGVPAAFPEIIMQLDVFHTLRDVGVHVRRQERRAISELSELYSLENKVKGPKARTKAINRYEELSATIDDTLKKTDSLLILHEWLRELMGFSGYGYEKSFSLCLWILDEMEALYPEKAKYQKAISQFRNRLPDVLKFLRRFRINIHETAVSLNIDEHDLMLLYNQTAYPICSKEYAAIDKRLFKRLGKRILDAREALPNIIHMTYRASSMVENVNSRVRCYMNLKREVPENFIPLLNLYLNTRKAKRPSNKSWTGTSALDRLTGHDNPEFLDLLFGEPDYLINA